MIDSGISSRLSTPEDDEIEDLAFLEAEVIVQKYHVKAPPIMPDGSIS
jgi:hypothetical protein